MFRVTAISDLHCKYPDKLPGGDLLIDAGDWTYRGRYEEVTAYLDWLSEQAKKYKYVVFIAGNHEVSAEDRPKQFAEWLRPYTLKDKNIFYLQEQEIVLDGFKIYGAPQQPRFGHWAFNVSRGGLHKHWDKIPNDTDILVTHGPPRGYGDFVPHLEWDRDELGQENWVERLSHEGCDELLVALKRVQPQYHVFGHIHYAYGTYYGHERDGIEDVVLVNAALNSEKYTLDKQPINFYLEYPKNLEKKDVRATERLVESDARETTVKSVVGEHPESLEEGG